MSGIAGMVVPAGRLVDEPLLRRMAASMACRGPDGHHTWICGPVGFAHALLSTSDDPPVPQPATLDGCVWITADARIDDRDGLCRKLEAAGRIGVRWCGDAQLILHAYGVWGEQCVDHLLGDFAFAIWDGRSRRLFCARDHFGIKPLYYAAADGGIVFSNTLECIRLHPDIGDRLDELAVADFLLFGCHQDSSATTYAHVRRLPPAHVLSIAATTPAVRKYWSLPESDPIRYRRSRDYVDRFTELFRAAVDDRIRGTRPAVWMSGGLDSTAIAATAQRILSDSGAAFQLRSYTVAYESFVDDDDPRYANLAARALGISSRVLRADHALPFDDWDRPRMHTPEPIDDAYHSLRTQQLEDVASVSRVALAGDGGDEVLWRPYLLDLVGVVPAPALAADLARCLLVHGRRPAVGVRATLARWRRRSPQTFVPAWLNADLVARWNLRDRVRDAGTRTAHMRSLRPEVYRRLSSPFLHAFLEGHDPGVTRVGLEHRWPFLDVRLVSYLLSVPPVPWCVDKVLLRVAMRGLLPDSLLRRPKSPFLFEPVRAHLLTPDLSWLNRFEAAPQLSRFVERRAVPPVATIAAAPDPWVDLRPLCLNYWLSRVNAHAC